MEAISLDNFVKALYDSRVESIRESNIRLEREFFTKKVNQIPHGEMLREQSYEDVFANIKDDIKDEKEDAVEKVFYALKEYYLFSFHDLIYKRKLEADIFNPVPIEEFIFPRLLAGVKSKYNDVSIMRENPNLNANLEGIDRIVYTYTELSSLLFFLYASDFKPQKEWERLYEDTYEELIKILKNSDMTIGDFLHALIDNKCNIMAEIFAEVEDQKLRIEYQDKVKDLRKEKHDEIDTYPIASLHITYFFDHGIFDISKDRKSSIIVVGQNTNRGRIVLPNR